MATTKEASEQSMVTRLRQAGGRIDGIVAKARQAQDNGKNQVGRRVDALRAREARTRTRLRELRAADQAAWGVHIAELDRELDELEVEMAIADARLDAELAADDESASRAGRGAPGDGRPGPGRRRGHGRIRLNPVGG